MRFKNMESKPTPIAVPSTLDLFTLPATQYAIQSNLVTEHRPISTVKSDSTITFVITTPKDEYIQLKDLLLRLKLRVKITKLSGDPPSTSEWTQVSPVNYLLHSLFKQVVLEINGKQITVAPQTYSYKAMFEALIGFSEDARKSHLTGALYNKDATTNPDVIDTTRNAYISPDTKTSPDGKVIELVGKPQLDLSFQEKALMGGLTIKLEFTPNDPKFYLMADTTKIIPSVEFIDASIFVHRSKVSHLIVEAHDTALEKSNAKYPICRNEVKSFTISKDALSANIDNIVTGQIPRRALIALVSNDAFNGNYSKNPFNFKNYKCNFISTHIDGIQYPSIPYTPDFANDLFTREYIGFFEAVNQLSTDSVISLSKDDWAKGKTIYGFNYSPDLANGCVQEGHSSPARRGTMGLQLKFAEGLPETINALIYLEYDNLIQINSDRQVFSDYI